MEDKILKAIEGLRKDFNLKFESLSERVDNQGNQLKENTQILKSLEHLAQVNRAEHDKMSFDITEIYGEVKFMQKDLTTKHNCSDTVKLKSVK